MHVRRYCTSFSHSSVEVQTVKHFETISFLFSFQLDNSDALLNTHSAVVSHKINSKLKLSHSRMTKFSWKLSNCSSWKIDFGCPGLNFRLECFIQLRYYVNHFSLTKMTHGLFESLLNYCNIIKLGLLLKNSGL